jgi:excisionase family DNA binding protein
MQADPPVVPTAPRSPGAPWSLQEAAPFLSVSLRYLFRLAATQKVRTIRIGRRRLLPDAEVRRLANEGLGAVSSSQRAGVSGV